MKHWVIVVAMLLAQSALAGGVKIEQAWMRATAPGQSVAGAYMNITSTTDASLVGVSSPAAGIAQLHSMRMDNGVMKMRELQKIALPKNKMVRLEPAGMHIMLFDLKQAMKPGDVVPVMLDIATSPAHHEKIEVKVAVRDLGGH